MIEFTYVRSQTAEQDINPYTFFFTKETKMPLIEINLDETPDKLLPVSVGIRTLLIRDVTQDDEGVVTVELEINEPDHAEHERRTWDRFDFKYPIARIKFKQLCKAAGHTGTGGGVDPSELIGETVQAAFKSRVYKDKDTEEMVETTNIQKYIFDANE